MGNSVSKQTGVMKHSHVEVQKKYFLTMVFKLLENSTRKFSDITQFVTEFAMVNSNIIIKKQLFHPPHCIYSTPHH